MQLIDTHTHLDFPQFDVDRAEILTQSRRLGVERLVVVSVEQAGWSRLWQQAQEHPQLYAAFGLHPLYLDRHRDSDINRLHDWLERLSGHPQLCGVGEFGLDYFVESLDQEHQQRLFEAQLVLADMFRLPALLHVRRAHAQAIATLKRFRLQRGGIVHAFNGSYEQAREYIRLGFRLGLGGAVTWPGARRLQKMVAQLPDEAIVLETDSPDMAPAMHPNQRNSPLFLPEICTVIARLRQTDPERLAQLSTRNARQLFGWS